MKDHPTVAMRSDCRHFFRRTVDRSGDRVEGCAVDAAPDAPYSCPAQCPFFEKRSLSHTGFVYGSLAPDAPAASVETTPAAAPDAPSDEEAALLAELEQIVSEAAPQELERDRERRRAEDRTRRRRGRKRRD